MSSMKITRDVEELAKRFGSRMDAKEGSLAKRLWRISDCLDMIESHLAYNDYDFLDNRYAQNYIKDLGYDTVEELWVMAKKYFDENCYVEVGTYTDCEGLTYNSLIDRNLI